MVARLFVEGRVAPELIVHLHCFHSLTTEIPRLDALLCSSQILLRSDKFSGWQRNFALLC